MPISIDPLAFIVTVASLVFVIWLSIRNKQLYKPKLFFGLFTMPPQKKNYMTSSFIYCELSKKKSIIPIAAIVPIVISNRSKTPIKNCRIQLEYPQKYLITNEQILDLNRLSPFLHKNEDGAEFYCLPDKDHQLAMENFVQERETSKVLEKVCVSYELSNIRPGETLVRPEPIKLPSAGVPDVNELQFCSSGFNGILNGLKKNNNILDYLIMSMSLFAENIPPIYIKVNIYNVKCDKESTDYIVNGINDIGNAFWMGDGRIGGHYIKPKIFPLGQNLYRHELFVFSRCKPYTVTTEKHRQWRLTMMDDIEKMIPGILIVPNCDYYNLPDGICSTDKLIRMMGFYKIKDLIRFKT